MTPRKKPAATKPLALKEQLAAYEHENASLREFKSLLLVDKMDLQERVKVAEENIRRSKQREEELTKRRDTLTVENNLLKEMIMEIVREMKG